MAIVNGCGENYLLDIFNEKENGTWFNGNSGRSLNARAHWLTYRTTSKGEIVVDDGASHAMRHHRRSLLPKGIVDVHDSFLSGQVVDIVNQQGKKIAKGITNYSSNEIMLIKGKRTQDIESILHFKDYDEVIHANNMVLTGGDI